MKRHWHAYFARMMREAIADYRAARGWNEYRAAKARGQIERYGKLKRMMA